MFKGRSVAIFRNFLHAFWLRVTLLRLRVFKSNVYFVGAFVFFTLAILACDHSDTTTKPKNDRARLISTDALTISARRCDYNRHSEFEFQCFLAKQHGGFSHDYKVTVIIPLNSASDSALISIPGGPGQGGQTEANWIEGWVDWMYRNDIDQPLIIYEPPATFGSSAFWQCEKGDELSIEVAGKNASYAEEVALISPTIKGCISDYDNYLKSEGISAQGISAINSFTVRDALYHLIDALTVDKVNLIGTSYGSRVAVLAAGHQKVKSIVLDSPYPLSRGSVLDWPELLGEAFRLHEESDAWAQFKKTHTSVSSMSYLELLESAHVFLQENSQAWQLERWDGNAPVKFILNADRLLVVHYSVLYNAEMLPYFYYGLLNIKNETSELRWVLEDFVTLTFDPIFNTLMFMAVECYDNANVEAELFFSAAKESGDQLTDWETFYSDDACQHLPSYESYNRRVQAEAYVKKPTLILVGELDPVTPVSWGEEIAGAIYGAELYTRPSKGHAVLATEECLIPRIKAFWDTPMHLSSEDYSALIDRCVAKE